MKSPRYFWPYSLQTSAQHVKILYAPEAGISPEWSARPLLLIARLSAERSEYDRALGTAWAARRAAVVPAPLDLDWIGTLPLQLLLPPRASTGTP